MWGSQHTERRPRERNENIKMLFQTHMLLLFHWDTKEDISKALKRYEMALEQCFTIFKDNISHNISSGISVVIIAMLLFLLTEIGSVEKK